MSNDPWSILGLDPSAASEKDVKVAYAKLIRQHRPDTDPEGFQRVRQAYDAALAQLKNPVRTSGFVRPGMAPIPTDQKEPQPLGSVSFPPPVVEAQLALKAALDVGESVKISEASDALQKRCQEARPGFLGMELWNQSLHQLFQGDLDTLVKVVCTRQLLEELRLGQAMVSHSVIGWWAEHETWVALQELADLIEQGKSELGNEAAASVALRLGLLLSFRQPRQSRRLGHFAYPHLRLDSRDAQVHQVEQQAALGECFLGFPAHQAEFWRKRFDDLDGEFDWDSQEALDARRYLVITRRRDWMGFGFVQRVASEEWWNEFVEAMNRRAGGGGTAPSPKYSGGGSTVPRWAVVMGIFLVFRLLALFTNDRPTRSAGRAVDVPRLPQTAQPVADLVPAMPPPSRPMPSRANFEDALKSFRNYSGTVGTDPALRQAALRSCRAQLTQLKERTPLVAAELFRLRRGQSQQVIDAFSLYSQSTIGRSNAAGLACGLIWDEDTDHDIRLLAAAHLAANLSPGQLIELLSVTAHGTSSMKMATMACVEQFLTKRKGDALVSELERLTEIRDVANDPSK
ncbi:MAG: hypothetical protein H7A55_12800 [Verrucomicrobiaceae bacterium]|nr:hypothetical protein [Verrucomicrobiaceae bacterium]